MIDKFSTKLFAYLGLLAAIGVMIVMMVEIRLLRDSHESRGALISQIRRLTVEHEALVMEFKNAHVLEPRQSILDFYVKEIHRDGPMEHRDMRQRLTAIAENNTALLTLAEVYEKQAKTEAFREQLKPLRTYVITWNDRWNSLFEYVAAGGSYVSAEVPFPSGFEDAVKAEFESVQ